MTSSATAAHAAYLTWRQGAPWRWLPAALRARLFGLLGYTYLHDALIAAGRPQDALALGFWRRDREAQRAVSAGFLAALGPLPTMPAPGPFAAGVCVPRHADMAREAYHEWRLERPRLPRWLAPWVFRHVGRGFALEFIRREVERHTKRGWP